jgi:hypothetical protein
MPNLNATESVRCGEVTYGTAVCRLKHDDLTAAAVTETVTWAALVTANGGSNPPANARIMHCHFDLIEVFAGGSVATCVVDVGDAGTADELISAINIFTGATLGLTMMDGAYTLGTFEAAYTPTIKVTTTTDNVDALTTGELELRIMYQAFTADNDRTS